MAFEASRNERFPRLARSAACHLGVALFWTALGLEGRAFEVWRELRAQKAAAQRRSIGAIRDYCVDLWGDSADRLREIVWRRGTGECLLVPAWSPTRQPENTRAGPRPHVGGALPVLPRISHALAGRWPAHAAVLLSQGPQPLHPRICWAPAGRASRRLPPLVHGRLAKVAAPMGGDGLREFRDGGTAGSLEQDRF